MSRNKTILTKDVLARIPAMVANGANRTQIAAMLGCKLSTLQVRCSQRGIRLRARRSSDWTVIRLNRDVIAKLHDYAVRRGETEQALARRLIETIARDDLYAAVLDDEKAA